MQYTIIIEHGAKNFSAYAPDFPGCAAAADTEEETIALMKEALEMHIEDMRARASRCRLPVPYGRSKWPREMTCPNERAGDYRGASAEAQPHA